LGELATKKKTQKFVAAVLLAIIVFLLVASLIAIISPSFSSLRTMIVAYLRSYDEIGATCVGAQVKGQSYRKNKMSSNPKSLLHQYRKKRISPRISDIVEAIVDDRIRESLGSSWPTCKVATKSVEQIMQ